MTFNLSKDALDFALKHTLTLGDTDILPVAFEFLALAANWDDVRDFLLAEDLDTWTVRPHRKMLTPKGPLGFRIATQLDPLDSLIFTALVYEIGPATEASRVPTKDQVVLSHRFEPNASGGLYSRDCTFETFRRRSLELADVNPNGWVAVTDIADFYPRLYSHPLENALREAVPPDHARVLVKLIKQWNQGVSYGIPVGPAASRLLAELAIADVDAALLGSGVAYCRYSDDFRLFGNTEEEALGHLTMLAGVLQVNHGLTLQEAKTEVISCESFKNRFQETDRQRERRELEHNFFELLERLDIDSYEKFEYDDLNQEQQRAVDQLNLNRIVRDQLDLPRMDQALTGFALRRLAQVGDIEPELANLLLERLADAKAVFGDALEALEATYAPGSGDYERVMSEVLKHLSHPRLRHLEFYRLWILNLFRTGAAAKLGNWQGEYGAWTDGPTRRELLLLAGYQGNAAWLRTLKARLFDLGVWERRAYLAAASCLPKDERSYWYDSVRPQLDRLEQWVVAWAKTQPLA